jgi:hypothetical protein
MTDTHNSFASFTVFAGLRPIDTTVWIGQWPTRLQVQASAESLGAMAERFQLEGMCVSHIASLFGYDTLAGNEALFRECVKDERLWPFPVLNPADPTWRSELAWSVQEGAAGIRLAPGYHRCETAVGQMLVLLAAVREVGLPVQVCARLMDERIQHPFYQGSTVPLSVLAELTIAMQGQPLLISGLRLNEWDEVVRLLPEGTDMGSLFFDLWYCNGPLGVISSLCAKGGDRSFLYGSCAPVQTVEATALQIDRAGITDGQRLALAAENARRFLQGGRKSDEA